MKDPSKDNFVSNFIARGEGWEMEPVSKIMEAMSQHPEAVFIGNFHCPAVRGNLMEEHFS